MSQQSVSPHGATEGPEAETGPIRVFPNPDSRPGEARSQKDSIVGTDCPFRAIGDEFRTRAKGNSRDRPESGPSAFNFLPENEVRDLEWCAPAVHPIESAESSNSRYHGHGIWIPETNSGHPRASRWSRPKTSRGGFHTKPGFHGSIESPAEREGPTFPQDHGREQVPLRLATRIRLWNSSQDEG